MNHQHGINMPANRPILLVDMDGPLANLEMRFLNIWQAEYPERFYVPLNERTTFYIEDQYPKKYKDDIWEILDRPGFFATFPQVTAAVASVHKLYNMGYDVFICTAPLSSNPTCATEKRDWIRRCLGTEWIKRMVITDDKTIVQGTFLLDDKPKVKGVVPNPTWEHIVYGTPSNEDVKDKYRVRDWMHAVTYFEKRLSEMGTFGRPFDLIEA